MNAAVAWPSAFSIGPDLTVQADADQLGQRVIKRVGKAVGAALETKGEVEQSG